MEKTYRTAEQFEKILDSMINGNWTQSADECIEYGFYSQDLCNHWEGMKAEFDHEPCDPLDLVHLIELATERRYKEDI